LHEITRESRGATLAASGPRGVEQAMPLPIDRQSQD
jgi:hypothetical protein